jgi:hypothetical protein
MGDLAQAIGGARQFILVIIDQRQTQARDRLGVEHRRQTRREGCDLEALRRDQIEVRLFGLRHVRASLRLGA